MVSTQRGLTARIAVPVALVFALVTAVLVLYVRSVTARQTIDESVQNARATIAQYKTLRAYYTEHVVSKVKATGAVDVTFDHRGRAGAIPLPATMIHDLSEAMGKDATGLRLRLYSAYPFPNRRGRVLDGFAQEALGALARDPDATFVRTESLDGRPVVRVAAADRLVADACVTCHNSRADSPKKDWKLGEMRGALEIIVPMERQVAANRALMTTLTAGAGGGALLLVAGLTRFIRRSIVRPIGETAGQLEQGAREVLSAAGQVAAASQTLSQGATEQAASLEESSASMEEMASMTRQNAEHAGRAATLMSQVDDQFRQSNGALGEMIASMAAMRESAARVSRIIKTIDEIAFQTNLLALNAAVEAARAGEAGTGFAVVAEEVRSLAQRSAQAARDTAGLIEESSERAKAGGHKVEEVAAAIGAVTGSIASVRQLVDEVSTASRQQADGIAQVSQALAQMEKVTQSTAATAEESAAASEELNAQADAARATVRHLAQLVHGGPSTDAPDRPAAPVGPSSGARTRRAVVTAIRQRPRNIPDPEQALPLGNTGTFNAF